MTLKRNRVFRLGFCYDAINKHDYDVLGPYRLIYFVLIGSSMATILENLVNVK